MSAAKEADILREVRLSLGSRADVRLFRFAAGNGWVRAAKGFIPCQFVPPGFPDLFGWVFFADLPVILGVECKSASGRLSAEQLKWRDLIVLSRGFHVVARSAAQANEDLDRQIQARKQESK